MCVAIDTFSALVVSVVPDGPLKFCCGLWLTSRKSKRSLPRGVERVDECNGDNEMVRRRESQRSNSGHSPIVLIDQSDNLNPILDNIIHNISGCTQSGGWT